MSRRPILLTGFEGFGEFPVNSSWEAVRTFDGHAVLGIPIAARLLPVSFRRIRPVLRRILDELRPCAVVAFGLAPRPVVAVERRAVDPGRTSRAYPSTLPVENIARAVTRVLRPPFSARLSDDAGRFLCNAAFYHLAVWAARPGGGEPVGFIHVPPLESGISRPRLRRVARAAARETARFADGCKLK